MQEIRYALRQLRRSPGFTLAAILTLAVGIGANVAVFSVMNAVLLNPTGIPHSKDLIALRVKYASLSDLQNISISAPDFQDSLESRKTFQSAAAMQPVSFNYSPDSALPVRFVGAKVTAQWFDVFQVRPAIGRTFRPEDDVPGSNNVVVLSDSLWRKQFGGDSGIVGRALQLNGSSYTVIGVMTPEFDWPNGSQFWTPLAQPPARYHDTNYRFNENLFAVARLQPGVTIEQANAVESSLSESVKSRNRYARSSGWGMFAVSLREFVAGDLSKPLTILLAAVGLVLLIACANIAGLQLARASDHHHENSVRVALGASRTRRMVPPFLERVFIGIAGLGIGIAIAVFAMPSLLLLAPQSIRMNLVVHINLPILLFAAGVSVLCVLLCGTAPALHVAGTRFMIALREGTRSGTASQASNRMRSALVVTEITIAMFLLVCSGLLLRSLQAVERLSTGFEPQGVMTASLSLPPALYKDNAKQEAFYSAALQSLKGIPGVSAASFISDLPFAGGQGSASFDIKGQVVPPNSPPPHGHISLVSPEYFQTLGIPLLQGRTFTDGDRENTEQVAMVDETLARQYWTNKNVLGEHITIDDGKTWITVVGVVKHIKISSLDTEANEGFYFLPVAQQPFTNMSLAVRTSSSHPEGLLSAMEGAIRSVDPRQPLFDPQTMEQRIDDSLGSRRFVVVLLGIFAGLSLFLAGLGLYAVIAYLVRMRAREIGIRMALGAQRGQIAAMVLRRGFQMSLAGCLLGIVATYSAGRALSSMLYGVSLYNLPTMLGSGALLATLVLLASYLPARRAMRIDPADALRED